MLKKALWIFIAAAISISTGCKVTDTGLTPTEVSFSGLTANGTAASVTSTVLTLGFSADPVSLSVSDITVGGATKGALSGSGMSRNLAISDIKVADGAKVTVTISNPVGYTISPSARDATVYVAAATTPPVTNPPATTPIVTLGSQTGAITAGTVGSATFAATTANLADGTAGSITFYTSLAGTTAVSAPITGVTASVSAVANNAATVTMAATASAVAGSYYFTLTEGSAVSAVKTLYIAPAPTAVIYNQSGNIVTGTGGTVKFTVATTQISNGTTGTITWYTTYSGTTTRTTPAGISATVTAVSGNSATITMTVASSVATGYYYFKITEGTVSSALQNLYVDSLPSITVASQNGNLFAGTAGSATYGVTPTNVPGGTAGSIGWWDSTGTSSVSAPAWVSSSMPTTNGSVFTLSMSIDSTATAGTYYFKLTEGSAVSALCSLFVSAPVSVSLSAIDGQIYTGDFTNKHYTVTTAGIANGTKGTVNWYADLAGTSTASVPAGITQFYVNAINGNTATIDVGTEGNSLLPGSYYFKLTEGSAVSAMTTLTINLKLPALTLYTQAGPPIKIYVTANGVVGATSFDLYRSTSSGTQGTLLTNTGTNVVAYYDLAITSGTIYYYTAIAKDGSGHVSAASVQASAVAP